MRRIFIPEELTPLYLIEPAEMPSPLREMLPSPELPLWDRETIQKTLTSAEALFTAAWGERERYAAALVRLYQADLLNRQERWEEALDATREASGWLKLQVSQRARYNEAIATYFEGTVHYILHADQQATQAFIHAQKLLQENERFWKLQGENAHIEDCHNVIRWITQLLSLRSQTEPGGNEVMIVPLYELESQVPKVRISASAVPLLTLSMPVELVHYQEANAAFLPSDINVVTFPAPSAKQFYFAVKARTDGEFFPESKAGGHLLVEATSATMPTVDTIETLLNTKHGVLRKADGIINLQFYFAVKTRADGEFVSENKTDDHLLVKTATAITPTIDTPLNTEHVFLRRTDGTITFPSTHQGYPKNWIRRVHTKRKGKRR
jgi:hypothetical protein